LNAFKITINYVSTIIAAVLILIPILWVAISSFKSDTEFISSPWSLPEKWLFSNYMDTWEKAKFSTYMMNSLIYSISSILGVTVICAMAAYAIIRLKIWFSNIIYTYFIMGIMIPVASLIVPVYLLISKLNMLDGRLTIIIIYVAFAIPITIAMLGAYMRDIPKELEESAWMDGAGPTRIFISIITPLTIPAIATVTIINFMHFWNEFIFVMMTTKSDSLRSIPVGLASFQGEFQTDYSLLASGMMIALIPVVIVFFFMQERVIRGVASGAVKG
jgi:raffinose/stachyose/melibiose transport system permease protein